MVVSSHLPDGAPRGLASLVRIFRLGNENLLDAVDLKALPRVLQRVMSMAWRYKGRLLLSIAATLFATIFTLAIPSLLGKAVDQAHLGQGFTPDFWPTALLLVGASSLRGLLNMIAGYQGEYIAQRVGYDLRLQFFEKLQRLGFDFHDRVHSGDLITRGMLDLEGVRMFVETGVQRIISLVLLVVIGAVLMVRTDLLLTVLSLSFVPFVIWRASRTGLYIRLTWTRLQQRMSILTRAIEENLQGVRVVRAFAATAFELSKFDETADAALKLSNERILVRTASTTTLTFSFYCAMALVLWVGGHRVMSGAITIGRLTEFLTFMTVLQTPVRQVTLVVNTAARAISSGSRLFEILDLEPTVKEHPQAHDVEATRGLLRFDNVSFSYAPGTEVLSGINFEVSPGKTLGILGSPGAGKSTVAHLIPRFYDVTGGRITIDGTDIRHFTLASLRRTVSLVQQDVFLFDSSINDNIAYAEPAANEERVVEAATTAHIHEYVESLPNTYRTHVGERGVGLSGGQRQRLTIARGVVPEPAILVFDDATSAVDVATEYRLRTALKAASHGKTTIIIAHRLSSLMHADEIIVLDKGRIAERGTHASLVARGGLYTELYHLQADQRSVPAPSEYKMAGAAT